MASYLPLFNIQAEHGFFADNRCRVLNFVSTPVTDRIMENAGLLTRKKTNGISVFYDEDRHDALYQYATNPAEPLVFAFKALTDDSLFWNYTQPPVYKLGSLLYFDNTNTSSGADGRLRLHAGDFVGGADFEHQQSGGVNVVTRLHPDLMTPVFGVNINVSEKDFDQSPLEPKSYHISFQARQTYWKYYLLGDMANEDFYVTDQDDNVEFEVEGESWLGNNRTALAIRSKTLLMMQERSQYRFQLRDKNSGGGRVLIRRLPVASAASVSQEIIEGEMAFVSEIFINR